MEAETTSPVSSAAPAASSWASRHPEWSALLSSTLPIALLSGCAYLMGYMFHDTRLRTVGINPELYPKEAIDYFIHAYLAWFTLVAKALPFLTKELVVLSAIVLFWLVVTILAVAANFLENVAWVVRTRAAIARATRVKRAAKIVSVPVIASVLTVYIPLALVSVYVLPVMVGHMAGKVDGEAYVARAAKLCAAAGGADSICTEIRENGALVGYGLMIDASDSYIALVEKGQGRSIRRENKEFVTRLPAGGESIQGTTAQKQSQ